MRASRHRCTSLGTIALTAIPSKQDGKCATAPNLVFPALLHPFSFVLRMPVRSRRSPTGRISHRASGQPKERRGTALGTVLKGEDRGIRLRLGYGAVTWQGYVPSALVVQGNTIGGILTYQQEMSHFLIASPPPPSVARLPRTLPLSLPRQFHGPHPPLRSAPLAVSNLLSAPLALPATPLHPFVDNILKLQH